MTAMTPKERAMAAFEHRPTDRVPIFHSGLSSYAGSFFLGREAYVGGGIQQWRESAALWEGEEAHREFIERSRQDAFDLTRVLDQDIVRVRYWRMGEKPTRRIDDYTFQYGDPEGSWRVMRFDPTTELYQEVDSAPRPELTFDDLERQVEASEKSVSQFTASASAYSEEAAALEAFPDRAVRGLGVGINVEYRSRIWLEAIALRPDIVERLFDVQAERALRQLVPQAEIGLRLLAGGGDFASNQGPFYSPTFFREAMLPRLQRVTEAYHELDCYLLYASDGNLWPVADDLFGASGVDGYYEIDDRAGMDLRKLRERFPKLTLMGGLNSYTLHRGSREEVIDETRAAMEAARECGSILVGCSNQIVAGTPHENMEAMQETIDQYR